MLASALLNAVQKIWPGRNRSALLLAIGALCAAPAVASASDPLLSGYAGPGGGEQAVLGSELLPAATPRSLAVATAPAAAAVQAPAFAPARRPQVDAPARRGTVVARTPGVQRLAPVPATLTVPAVTLQTVRYPTRAGEDDGLPLGSRDVAAIVLGIAALAAFGVGLRRFTA